MNYKAVLFDMDGVIIDSERISKEIWMEVGKEWGISETKMSEVFEICLGMSRQDEIDMFNHILLWSEKRYYEFIFLVDKKRQEYKNKNQGKLPIKDGALEVLRYLKDNRCKIALVSSNSLENIKDNLTANRILSYFDLIISGEGLNHSKPHPEIYCRALNMIEESPENCLAVEDSPNGVVSALKSGISVAMIEDTVRCPIGLKPNIIINDLNSLIENFKGGNQE